MGGWQYTPRGAAKRRRKTNLVCNAGGPAFPGGFFLSNRSCARREDVTIARHRYFLRDR